MATRYAMKVFAALVLAVGTLAALGVGLTGGPTEPAATAAPLPRTQAVDPTKLTQEHIFLASHQKIQKELNLSAEARVAMIDALAEIDEEQTEFARTIRVRWGDELRKPQKDFFALRRAAVAKSLTADEFKRLTQIDWQLCGAVAFRIPEVAMTLALSDKQNKAVGEAVDGMFKVLNGKGAGRQAVLPYWNEEEFPDLWKAARDTALAQLNVAQRKKWDELTGPKLSFDPVKHLRTFGQVMNRIGEPAPEPPPVQVLIPEPNAVPPAQPVAPPPGIDLRQVGPFPQAPPAAQSPRVDDERPPQLPPPTGLTPVAPTGAPGTQPPLTAPPPSTLPPVGR